MIPFSPACLTMLEKPEDTHADTQRTCPEIWLYATDFYCQRGFVRKSGIAV